MQRVRLASIFVSHHPWLFTHTRLTLLVSLANTVVSAAPLPSKTGPFLFCWISKRTTGLRRFPPPSISSSRCRPCTSSVMRAVSRSLMVCSTAWPCRRNYSDPRSRHFFFVFRSSSVPFMTVDEHLSMCKIIQGERDLARLEMGIMHR